MGSLINTHRGTVVRKVRLATKCMAKPVTDVLSPGAWADSRCFIIGGGPSLVGFDFSQLDGEKTIGINKAFVHYHATVNYSMDHTFFEMVELNRRPSQDHYELHKKWCEYHGIKLFLRTTRQRYNENVYYVSDLGKKGVSFNLQQGIYKGNNSGCGALMLAVALGCKRIGLLGYDFVIQQDGVKVKTHWHEGYDRGTIRSMLRNLENFRDCIEELGPCLPEMGVSVYNLNPDSGLRCFEKISMESFLALP